jgi:porphobilinogen synthase
MVKPALLLSGVLAEVRPATDSACRRVQCQRREYSMIHAAAERGWGDLHAMARESLAALDRAGARPAVLSYWAPLYRDLFG